MNTQGTDSALSFEKLLSELELLLAELESGALPLETAIETFERGIHLARAGQKKLHSAEQRVDILLNQDSESEAGLSSFTNNCNDL